MSHPSANHFEVSNPAMCDREYQRSLWDPETSFTLPNETQRMEEWHFHQYGPLGIFMIDSTLPITHRLHALNPRRRSAWQPHHSWRGGEGGNHHVG